MHPLYSARDFYQIQRVSTELGYSFNREEQPDSIKTVGVPVTTPQEPCHRCVQRRNPGKLDE